MRRLLVFAMVVLTLSLPRMAQAHFVWIEAEPVAKPDAPVDPRAGTLAFLPGHELLVRFSTKTQPTARVRLQAQGPNGWIKEMRPSDSWGVTSFVPLWPGRYVISLERNEPSLGELQGRKYDTISQRVTFSFLVEASR
jgi:hypothetical protein